ncbi:TrmB family transcriptional regulator [Candidatus Acidianus copahuensis]|uniref:TrmB family transcriptional regulator n=1 Tax=Candidatus Acidianus copahuensis TaxID=1160895 RepID=A0A031LLZ1_9CREN|nr:helix-turn-helix domain-containing protein [Candidatus Acidianus copahuensis]EZQ01893.1 TrmB family transcriptional regulator [Candidatus Acidianus copahuensis]
MSIEISDKSVLLKRFLMVGYGLSEADVDAFTKILGSSEGKDVDTISEELGISKSRASLILKKLADAGLIDKKKSSGAKGGRPKFVYYVSKQDTISRLLRKAQELCSDLSNIIKGL